MLYSRSSSNYEKQRRKGLGSKCHDYLSSPGATMMILPMTDDLRAAHLRRGYFGLLCSWPSGSMITMLRGTRQVSGPGARCQLAMSHGGLLSGRAHSPCCRRSGAVFTTAAAKTRASVSASDGTARVNDGRLGRPSEDDDRRGFVGLA